MSKAVVLLSGGIDSATCLAMAKDKGHNVYALSFDYGQRSVIEIQSARAIATSLGAIEHKIVNLRDLGGFGGSALTDTNIELKTSNHKTEIPTSYVPGRNTVFIAIALSLAEAINADEIYTGIHNDDRSCYPDCRPEYIDAYRQLAMLSNKRGIENNPIKITTPLLNMTKGEIIRAGNELGLDYTNTVTCYQANDKGEACGKCLSCTTRKNGFSEAGIPDQTRYKS